MKIYVYLDESGSIHKNSKTRYFAVGGYFSLEQDKLKIKAKRMLSTLPLRHFYFESAKCTFFFLIFMIE